MATVPICVAQCQECDVGWEQALVMPCSILKNNKLCKIDGYYGRSYERRSRPQNKMGEVGRKTRTGRLGNGSQQWQHGDKSGEKFNSKLTLLLK